MNLLDLFVKIGVNDEATEKVGKISSSIGDGLKKAAKIGSSAMAAVTAAVVATTAAIGKNIAATAEYADSVDKMSQKMGMSAEAYQEWDFIMQHSGTSMETLKASMKTMANAADMGSDAFDRLGISQEEVGQLSQEDLFNRVIEGLQGVENETERTALAGKLLGRGATELGPLLNTSAEDIEAMRQQVHDLNGVMSDEAVKAGAAYQDSLQNLGVSVDGLKRGLSAQFLPVLVDMMDGLALVFSGDNSGFAKIEKGINDFVTKLNDAIPKILEFGSNIIMALLDSIIQNLPQLVDGAFQIISELALGIMDALPQIIDAAAQIIVTLVDAITQDPDKLVETAIELITTIAEALLDALPQIIVAGVQLMVALVQGIIENIPEIIEAGADIINALIEAISDLFENLKDIGKDVVAKIREGISAAWDGLKNWFNNLWDGLFGNRDVNVNVNGNDNTGGDHARGGLDYVPYDDYPVDLHKGEMVLTAPEAAAYRQNGAGAGGVQVNQYISVVPQTPVEFAAATESYFEQARWSMA